MTAMTTGSLTTIMTVLLLSDKGTALPDNDNGSVCGEEPSSDNGDQRYTKKMTMMIFFWWSLQTR